MGVFKSLINAVSLFVCNGPLPPGRIPAMLMKKFPQHVTSAGFSFEFAYANRLRFIIPFVNGVPPVIVLIH